MAGLIGALTGWCLRGWPMRRRGLGAAIGVLLVVAGVGLVLLESEELAREWQHRRWPTTEGTIVASRVIGTRAFRPDIVYEYAVAGTVYQDSTTFDTPAFGGRNSKFNVAETIAKSYPVGKKVAVRYDPANPARSGLRAGPTWDLYGKLGLGGVLFGLGVFGLMVAGLGGKR